MDIEWLQNLYKNPLFKKYGVYFLILIIILYVADKIATISDIGFSDEIKQYRWTIIFLIVVFCIITALIIEFARIRQERNSLESKVTKLVLENEDIQKQKESLLRLMGAYKLEAQEDIFNRLRHLAIFTIKREQWIIKAKVERFRVEKLSNRNPETIDIIDHTTVIINLGLQDDAMEGMKFIIQDPTDGKKYGVVRIEKCFEIGSACSIIEMEHPAFWNGIEVKNMSKEKIIEAPANCIVPYTPYKELDAGSAKQILEWLQNLEEIEL